MTKHNTKFRCICAECGGEFGAQRSHGRFCGRDCNRVFHRRRHLRGIEVYDFLMSKRFDRATEAECRGILDSLASGYRESDRILRDGRKSWLPLEEAKRKLPRLAGCADGR